ncbi:MAG: TIGR00297 family protein [Halanaeroarchaeum sp.]
MTRPLRRSAAFSLVSALSLAAGVLGQYAPVPFVVVAVVAALASGGRFFDLFANRRDRNEGSLYTLLAFSLTGAGLALLIPTFALPVSVFAATMLTVGFGDLGRRLVLEFRESEVGGVAGFVVLGGTAAFGGQVVVNALHATVSTGLIPEFLFVAASAGLLGALLRSVFGPRDEPLMLATVALLLWLFADLAVVVSGERVLVALAITVVFGYLSYALEAASIPGMLTGVFLALLAVVLGGYGWFAVLIAFFAIGGLSTKYRYDEKLARGVAEPNEGARGSGNVLGNSLAALFALLLFAAHGRLPLPGAAFAVAFTGSMATALADTLSSEIGGLYDRPRLVTTLQPVEPGTDGAVTWQGEVAGLAGAVLVAAMTVGLFAYPPVVGLAVVAAGVVGMTADSLVGATIEGSVVGNQAVNFIATTVGAIAGGLFYLVLVGP